MGKKEDLLIISSEELKTIKDINWGAVELEKVYVVDNQTLDLSKK